MEGSLAETISHLTQSTNDVSDAACVVLRALSEDQIIQDNSHNQTSRYIVEVAEKFQPHICSFIKIEKYRQNYEKFSELQKLHEKLIRHLEPLAMSYKSIDPLLAAKGKIQAGLKHGQVRNYLRPYNVAEFADLVESILANLERVSGLQSTLNSDVEACGRDIALAKAWVRNNPSFLSSQYLLPFAESSSTAIETFLAHVRGRISAKITRHPQSRSEVKKRYPLHEDGKQLRILVPMWNEGPGVATDVVIKATTSSDSIAMDSSEIHLGSVAQGEFSIPIEALVIDQSRSFPIDLHVMWSELGGNERKEDIFEVSVLAQRADIDWQKHKYMNPYSTAPAEGERFVGREEQVEALVGRMLQTPMEATYIDGQKRVGKTSLAIAAVDAAVSASPEYDVRKCNILWGNITHVNPEIALKKLGEEIEEFILNSLPRDCGIGKADYSGSLSPIIKLATKAANINSKLRFVFIIDEFDEIPQEMFLQGNLAETFFANIRAITNTSNIYLLLVGGENMPFVMERQGQKLNKYARVNLTYFSRSTEWVDFEHLVRQPTENFLEWHGDAVSEIFNFTNGNPYFAKIICNEIATKAVREKDADITDVEVREVVAERISFWEANIFAHLWQDGIPLPQEEREPIYLKRRRTLVSITRCLRSGLPTTFANIRSFASKLNLAENELQALLADFVSRDVLREAEGKYHFVLSIFGKWLEDIGLSRLANDGLAEDLASEAQKMEDEAYVIADEIVQLTKRADWLPYRGKTIGADEIRAWISQCPSNRDQRILFKLLQSLRIVGAAEVLQRLRTAGNVIRDSLGVPARKSNRDRRTDVIVTYVDGEGKSGQRYAADFAEENKIGVDSIINPASFGASYEQYRAKFDTPKGIVIIDDIVATGDSLAVNVASFVENNLEMLRESKPILQVYALFGTESGCSKVRERIEELDYNRIDFRVGEKLSPSHFAFAQRPGIFANENEFDRAKSLLEDLGAKIYKKNPLGYGGMGLLLILPMTVPNNSLPVLHTHSKGVENLWRPLFERITN